MATNRDNWQFDSTFTVRVEKAVKDRLRQEAEARGVPFSEHVRNRLVCSLLPGELLASLSPEIQARIKKLADRLGRDAGEVLMKMLLPEAIPFLLDRVSHGV